MAYLVITFYYRYFSEQLERTKWQRTAVPKVCLPWTGELMYLETVLFPVPTEGDKAAIPFLLPKTPHLYYLTRLCWNKTAHAIYYDESTVPLQLCGSLHSSIYMGCGRTHHFTTSPLNSKYY